MQLVHTEEVTAVPRFSGPALQPSAQRLGDTAGRLSASDTTARATAAGRSAAWTVTMLMICSASTLPGRHKTLTYVHCHGQALTNYPKPGCNRL